MTHLSDYSFLQRATGLSYLLIWLLYRVKTTGGFGCLHYSRIKRGELKSIVTALILFMLPFQLYYDIVSCRVKYEEGFVQIPGGRIVTKPEFLWTEADRNLITPTDYSICVGFSLQIGTLLLLQCFWKYLAKLVARAQFMSSKEFKFYIIMTITNIVVFPLIQFNFTRDIYDSTYKEIMPELFYGCELLVISFLGGVSHFRFKKLLGDTKSQTDAQFITHRIRYFQELNLLLSVCLFFFSTFFIILSADGLSTKRIINLNKFASDFFICNINLLCIMIWVIVVLILHPKQQTESSRGILVPNYKSQDNSLLESGSQSQK